MKWISVKDKLPDDDQIIVGMTNGRAKENCIPVDDGEIVILRLSRLGPNPHHEWSNMEDDAHYYFPHDCEWNTCDYFNVIIYWMSWEDFGFPESVLNPNYDKQF